MVAVAQHHTCYTIVHCCLPAAVACQVLVEVALYVSLVHHVEAESVHHGVHLRLTRIVRCAHGVHVSLLHHCQVLHHGLHVDSTTILRVSVLSVHAFEVDTLVVDVDEVAALCDVAETVLCRERHFLSSVLVLLAYNHCVEIRVFSAPRMQVAETAEFNGLFCCCFSAVSLCSGSNLLAVAVEQRYLQRLGCRNDVAVVYSQLHRHCCACSVAVERRCDVVVRHEHLRSSHEIYVAVDTREVPHILTFEIRTVAPTIYTYRELVVAGSYEVGDVELGVGVRTLRVAYVLAVHPYHGSAVYAVEMYKHTLVLPCLRNVDGAAIETRCVVVSYTIL